MFFTKSGKAAGTPMSEPPRPGTGRGVNDFTETVPLRKKKLEKSDGLT